MTKFCTAELVVEGLVFTFDGNGKITLDGGTFNEPKPNSFSLPHIRDCPGSTPICRENCYVGRLKEAEPEVYAAYERNSENIKTALRYPGLLDRVVCEFALWVDENAPHGFRWHVSGDIFSLDYAKFIARVCRKSAPVPFWIYTRSFDYLEPLINIGRHRRNLTINLSVDRDNYKEARRSAPYGRLCYMTVDGEIPDLPSGSVIFPSYQLRGRDLPRPTDAPWWQSLTLAQKKMVCAPDFFGQSDAMRCGVCDKCLVPA